MKIIKIIFFVFIIINNAYANEDFENWLNSFTKTALDSSKKCKIFTKCYQIR